jgi:excisionase family DNA binding protein
VSAAIDLVREALRDPGVKAEVRAIIADVADESEKQMTPEPLVDAVEAARLLGMTAEAVRKAAYRRSIPSVKIGRRYRFRPSELIRT